MSLKTNYRNDVLDSSVTTRQYNMVNNANGTISLTDATPYSQTGTTFGADDINATNTQVNENTDALGGIVLSYNSTDGHFYAKKGSVTKKLGSAEGSATSAQVLAGTTFCSSNYDDVTIGTMKDNGAISKTMTPSSADQAYTVPAGYHNGSGKVTVKAVTTTTPSASKILTGSSVVVESNSVELKRVDGTMVNNGSKTLASGTVTNSPTVAAVKIPSNGYYNTSSKLEISQSAIANVIPLGTGSSFNIKSLYPSIDCSTLTTSNFIVELVSATATASSVSHINCNNFSYATNYASGSASKTITVSKKYVASTGVLTVSGLSGDNTETWDSGVINTGVSPNVDAHKMDNKVEVSVTVKAYLMLGSLQS